MERGILFSRKEDGCFMGTSNQDQKERMQHCVDAMLVINEFDSICEKKEGDEHIAIDPCND